MKAHQQVQHQQHKQRFVIAMGDTLAHLDYELTDGSINFTHTWVPPELRGNNLAQILVHHGLNWANTLHLDIRASCGYVQKFLDH